MTKINFMLRDALRATPHPSAFAATFPSEGKAYCRVCFADRDFMTAPPGVYAILCSCKERLCQESTLRGLRREVRFIMSPPGKRRHNELNAAPPPETPRRTGKTGEASDSDEMHSGESFRVRAKAVSQRSARHDPYFGFPFEGCEAGARY